MALIAFNLELATIVDKVKEPLLGEIRLQWWEESLAAMKAGTPPAHDVAQAVSREQAR